MEGSTSTPDFIAIDFETATRNMNSACAVGIAIVKDNKIADRFYSLIQPPENIYDPQNIAIHGIHPEDTEKSPGFREIWYNKIWKYFGHCPIVAHNANFDMSVLSRCCTENYIDVENFKYIDTMDLCKGIVQGSKSLSNCAEWFGISLENHHNALADAEVCAEIALACIRDSGNSRLIDFCFNTPHILIHNFSELKPMDFLPDYSVSNKKRRHFESVSPREICPCTNTFDQSHPLCGKNIVFTGELSIDRRTAMQMAADVGGVVKSSVSGKTDYLVVGAQDLSLVGADGMSTKEEKAYDLNASGKGNIQIIDESEFMNLLQGQCSDASCTYDNCLGGNTFVITGKVSISRDELAMLIEQHGGKASGAVSRKTSYVIAGEDSGSKLRKAEELGIPVISEDDFYSMIGLETTV